MKTGVLEALKEVQVGLSVQNLSYLDLFHLYDFQLEENNRLYRVFWATLSNDNRDVYDAWVICGDGLVTTCDSGTFTTLKSAISQHIGQLVMGGYLMIESVPQNELPDADHLTLP